MLLTWLIDVIGDTSADARMDRTHNYP